jgi:gas vesicle protein
MDKITEAFQSGDMEKTKKLLREAKFGDEEINKKVKELVKDAEGGVKTILEKIETRLKQESKQVVSELTQISKNTNAMASSAMFTKSNYVQKD